MRVLDQVSELTHLPQKMAPADADALRLRLAGEAPKTVLEICQNLSAFSLYLLAVLEDLGSGTLTSFEEGDSSSSQEVSRQIKMLGLDLRLSVLPSDRSYAWALRRLIAETPRPQFDVCILNGHKTWEAGGFGAVLGDMLLRPGGLMVLPDLGWSMATSPYFKERPQLTQKYAADELHAQPVKLIAELLLPHLGYEMIAVPESKAFALARKR